jgi:hypothetical protein
VVIDSTWDTVALSVNSQPIGAVAKLSTIDKIRKYRRLQEGHHFIMMAMKVHIAFRRDVDCFIKEFVCLFHDRWLKGYLSLFVCIPFLGSVLVLLFNVFKPLLYKIKLRWQTMLILDLPLLLDLTICLQTTFERLALSIFLGPMGCASFGLSLTFPFCLPWDGCSRRFFIGFLLFLCDLSMC